MNLPTPKAALTIIRYIEPKKKNLILSGSISKYYFERLIKIFRILFKLFLKFQYL